MLKRIIIFLCVVYLSCSKPEKPKEEAAIIGNETKESFSLILQENQKLQTALLSLDELPSIAKLLNSIEQAISVTKEKQIQTSLTELETILKNINPEDKESFYLSISKFSEGLAKINSDYKIDNKYNKFYCPMVSKYWISEGEKINNPYDPEMRDCGELVK